jgi:6-methylsalicylate decarboxylase
MRVDVHAHYFPSDYVECLGRLGYTDAREAMLRAGGAGATLDGRIALLDRVGVDVQVLSVAAAMPHLPREEDAIEAARVANDCFAAACAQYAGRLAAFACVPLPHVDAALAEAARGLDELGMVGVTVGCSVAGRQLDDPAFEPFYAELDRRGAVLFLHPVGVGCGPASLDYGMRWMIGAPVEDAIAVLRLTLSGLTTRFSRMRIIVPHLGGFLPFLLQRLDDEAGREAHAGVGPAVEGLPSEHVRRLWFDTVNCLPAALRCACEAFGADRILLGTDYPYLAGPRFEHAVRYVEEAGLAPADAAAIAGGNAAALLGLDGR